MDFIQNFPFFSIMLSMFSGTVCSVLPRRAARWVNTLMISLIGVLSFVLLSYLVVRGESYVYMMGHFPAPWGNEIRAGILEAGTALFFFGVKVFFPVGGGQKLVGGGGGGKDKNRVL